MARPISSLKIAVVAGESSGDLLAAGLIQALRKHVPNLEVVGVAGPQMEQAGCNALFSIEDLSVMGFIEPLKQLPKILKIRKALLTEFIKNPPDVFIGIDAPDFNLSLELQLKKHGIPVIHYVSPSVWAWRRGRVHKIKRAVDLMLTLFPFEMDFYKKFDVPVQYVGHPLADRIPLQIDQSAARRVLQLPDHQKIIAIMPGSRAMEVKHLGPTFIRAAQRCFEQDASLLFVTSMVNKKRMAQFQTMLNEIAPNLPIQCFEQHSREVMAAADVVLLTSGTVTLEAMLLKRPMVVAYRMHKIVYQLMKRLVKLPYFSLPNLIAKKRLVPEYLQKDATPAKLSRALLCQLNDFELQKRLIEEFELLHQALRQNTDEQVADAILKLVASREVESLDDRWR